VALHTVRLACELPDLVGRSLSQWDCTELARQLIREAIVEAISPQTVRRMLASRRLKPWRVHAWLHPRSPRDAEFVRRTRDVADLLTRGLGAHEAALSLDEMTSLQPRPRLAPTRPARPGRPVQVEHEYERQGAMHLFAAFDTRTGRAYGECFFRKRQVEFLTFLEQVDAAIPPEITAIHLLADNVSVHHGRKVRRWLARHPRFVPHFTPVHCSWMNPIEQWFGILRRKRLRAPDFADVPALAKAIRQFIREWNETAHPFRWTAASFEKILAKAEAALTATSAALPEAA
jgi:transposase